MRLSILALCLLPFSSFAAGDFPAGILHPGGRTAYLSTPNGIQAISLRNGEILWTRKEAHHPLFVAGDRLYAVQLRNENRLDILAYDLVNQQQIVSRIEVGNFPRWVITLDSPGSSFEYHWVRAKNVLQLEWNAYVQPRDGLFGSNKHAQGQIRIDLESSRVRHSPATPKVVFTPTEHRLLERQAVRWHRQIGGQLFAVVVEDLPTSRPGDRRQRLIFRAWEVRTGKKTRDKEILQGIRPVIVVDLSGMRLWIRDASVIPDQTERKVQHHWAVVSAVDGELITRVPYIPGTQVATLHANRAYCLTGDISRNDLAGLRTKGPELSAVDLSTGKILWQHRLGEAKK